MKNIDRYFRFKSKVKNKVFLKLGIISLLLILLCSCNNNDGNIVDDVEAVNMGDNISEDITNQNLEEALTKVKDEVNSLAGRADVETSELFSIENTHYIKVKIQDLMLHYEYIYEGSVEDKPTAFTAYTDRDLNNIEKEISGVYYEIWRFEKGDFKRILYNMEDVLYSRDDEKIIIEGAYNSYIIKLGTDKDGKEKILYECYYTDILDSDKGNYTCYINNFFSVCVVDNKNNEIILNKYIDLWNEFSNEDFILDNNRVLFPTRIYINDKGWIKDSNMAYFSNHDLSYVFLAIDIDNKIVSQPNFTSGGGYESFIDKDKGYIVSSDTFYALDTDTYMMEHLKKQYNYLYLINLYTSEKFEIAKSIRTKIEFKKEDENTISYIASSGERVSVDISDMIGKERSHVRDGFKDSLHSQLKLDESDSVNFYKFNDIIYAVVDDGQNKMLIQYNNDNKINIIADKLNDINFSELGKYISLCYENGDIIVLDKSGNKYLEDNVFNLSGNDTAIELGVTIWGKDNDTLYILTKKDDRLSNIFEVNMIDKSIWDLASDIDCRYENLYIDISEGYVVYSTFPGPIFYYYDKVVNDDVLLYVKYFTGEKAEIARAKGESIYFYIFDNELEFFCRENDDIEGTYSLHVDIPDNLSQEQEYISQEQELLLNGISLTKDIIRSVYRVYKGEEKYTYEVLLFSLAVNDDENNLYKGYFPFDENKGSFIFPLDKSNEVLTQVFGEKEYPSLEDVFDYDEESDIYYKNLDFGWVTAYRTENVTANLSDDKTKLYTQFELINQWYDVEGDPVPTAIAECKITYSIITSNDKNYLQFENMEILKKLVD